MDVIHLTSRIQVDPFMIKEENIECSKLSIRTVWVRDHVITVEVSPIVDILDDEYHSNLVFNIKQPWDSTVNSPDNALSLHQKIYMMIQEKMIDLSQSDLVESYMIHPAYSYAEGENWWEKVS